MAELLLVRHGQASFGRGSCEGISPLGTQQCRWLGEHLHDLAIGVDHVVTGTEQRHMQSASALFDGLGGTPPLTQNAGFDEFDFSGLHDAYVAQHQELQSVLKNTQHSAAERNGEFFRVLRLAFGAWGRDELELPRGMPWHVFADTIAAATRSVTQQRRGHRTLVVTSAGVIAMVLGQSLALEQHRIFELSLQVRNASVTQFFYSERHLRLAAFNRVAHLERADRVHAISYQ